MQNKNASFMALLKSVCFEARIQPIGRIKWIGQATYDGVTVVQKGNPTKSSAVTIAKKLAELLVSLGYKITK